MNSTGLIALICLPIGLFAQAVDPTALKTVDSLIQVSHGFTGKREYDNAIKMNVLAEKIALEKFGRESEAYGNVCSNYGRVWFYKGDYAKTEGWFLETKAIREKVLGKMSAEYAQSVHNLGIVYRRMGNLEKAESFYMEAINIRRQVLGNTHSDYGMSTGNLANVYADLGIYEKAQRLYEEALVILEKNTGKENANYAMVLSNLGTVYKAWDIDKAETAYLEAKSIFGRTVGKEHPDYTVCLNNLATILRRRGDYKAAEEYYTEAKDINEKAYGKLNERYGRGVLFLADVNTYMGNYEKAESLYLEAKQIFEQVIGKEHPDYHLAIKNLIYLYWTEGKFDLAKPYVLEVSEIGKNTIAKLTRHLSEREISINIAKFEDWMNYDFSSAQIRLELIPVCYNDILFYKGFLLNGVLQVSHFVRKDETTTEKYDRLKALHRRLATEYSKPINNRINLAELENQANDLEKELARSVAGFGESFQQVTWQEVQQALQPGEAAIEFVRFRLINRRPTDTIMYAALVLLPGVSEPAFIPLFEERELNKLFETNGRLKPDFIKELYSSSDLYRLLWQPLEQVLAEAQTIYFSPGGLLHRLNMGAIPMPPLLRGDETNATLSDRYHLIELGSARQLVVPLSTKPKGGEALLYGGIQYEMDSTAITAAISTLGSESMAARRGFDFANADSTLRGGKWGYLRWTDVEVSSAQEMLAEAGISPTVRKGYYGTEESFKTIGANGPSPRVLHLATHGFFFPDPVTEGRQQAVAGSQGEPVFKVSDHPMIRAGLVLAGGNHAWQTGQPFRPDREDGILTAYEISQMNLSNTELVVLSACETGLGDIQGNEGVYGLQRAFKIAGAKYLIMSLWQVPDFQTQELMTSFYSLWLEDKMPIPDAFQAAQKAMKAKYKSPFLWAGFVLVE